MFQFDPQMLSVLLVVLMAVIFLLRKLKNTIHSKKCGIKGSICSGCGGCASSSSAEAVHALSSAEDVPVFLREI